MDTMTTPPRDTVRALCAAALEGDRLETRDLGTLLAIEDEDLAGELFAAAREARAAEFGDGVFPYGFVYFSTYCGNDCAFCYYRADNELSPRYRKTPDEVVAICEGPAASGVDLLDLTMGKTRSSAESRGTVRSSTSSPRWPPRATLRPSLRSTVDARIDDRGRVPGADDGRSGVTA
jgi:hypothetical protein